MKNKSVEPQGTPLLGPPLPSEYDFGNRIAKLDEPGKRILYIWEFAREYLLRNQSKTIPLRPLKTWELVRAVAADLPDATPAKWEEVVVRTPFLTLPSATQNTLIANHRKLAMGVTTHALANRDVQVDDWARFLPLKGQKWKHISADRGWSLIRDQYERDRDDDKHLWLIGRFDMSRHDADLIQEFSDWLERARHNHPAVLVATKPATHNLKHVGTFSKHLTSLGRFRIGMAIMARFEIEPHRSPRGGYPYPWDSLAKKFSNRKREFARAKDVVANVLASVFSDILTK